MKKKKLFRNRLDEQGRRYGYGVVTGEKEAVVYLNFGIRTISKGDTILVYTDGYEDYVKISEFISLCVECCLQNTSQKMDDFMKEKSLQDIKYGRERSLIVVKVD